MKLKKQLQHLISMVKFSTVTHKLVGLGFDRVSSIDSQFNHPISYKNVKFLPSSQSQHTQYRDQ